MSYRIDEDSIHAFNFDLKGSVNTPFLIKSLRLPTYLADKLGLEKIYSDVDPSSLEDPELLDNTFRNDGFIKSDSGIYVLDKLTK